MQEDVIREQAERLVVEYDVRTPGILTPVRNLSGGNQQKVIVARELSRPVKLTIASHAKRGAWTRLPLSTFTGSWCENGTRRRGLRSLGGNWTK